MDGRRFVADADGPSTMLEGFVLLFHAASGITHLLASPAPEILAAIAPARGPATVEEIVARLRDGYDLEGEGPDGFDPGAHAAVAARLDELAAVGLVRAA